MADIPNEQPTQPPAKRSQSKKPEAGVPAAKRASNLKTTGDRWIDASSAFLHGEQSQASTMEEEERLSESSWENVTFDLVKQEIAQTLLEREGQFEAETAKKWDQFYSKHNINFFKDRKYLAREFPDLADTPPSDKPIEPTVKLLEVGCGVGNTVFPILKTNLDKFVYCFDCSHKAIELVKEHELFVKDRCHAFVCSFSDEDIPEADVPHNSIDLVTMIFVLSAVPPEKMVAALKRIHQTMKPGGTVLFRDYGMYDLTQMRFSARAANKMADNYYRRSDGTFTTFFTVEYLNKVFTEAGFEVESNDYVCRVMRNRKRKISMYRVWIQARFRKPK